MDTDEVTRELDTFASWPRAFTVRELLDFADSEVDGETLQRVLETDHRFVPLGRGELDGDYFIGESALFRWFSSLSLRLARARQSRLSERQLTMAMNSLRAEGRWDVPPLRMVEFGERFGFCGHARTSGQYVFPIAHLLSSMLPLYSKLAANLLQTSAELREPRAPSEAWLRGLVQQSLSVFGDRTAYVVQARKGLLTGEKQTLEQIGSRLGVTRERVRQLEMKPRNAHWKRRRAFMRPLLVALLADVMCRHGSLILRAGSPGTSLKTLIAEHAGIPQWEVPDTRLVVLGASSKDIATLEGREWSPSEIETDTIANHLESRGRFCLANTDVMVLAETIARFRRKHLNKSQRVCLALREIGKPAHYSAITEVYNRLFPRAPSTENNVHAILCREQHGVVWIGVRGTYGLKEWGYDRPSKGLSEAVADIVENQYEATGTPVPFAVIAAEMGKLRRVVKLSSLVFATHCNRRLRRVSSDSFVPGVPDDQSEEEIPEDELDRILQDFEEDVVDDSRASLATAEHTASVGAVRQRQGRFARLGSAVHHAMRRLRGTTQDQAATEKPLAASVKLTQATQGAEERAPDLRQSGMARGTVGTHRSQIAYRGGKGLTIMELARSRGLEVIDERPRGGCLWIVGGKELHSLLSPRGFIWGPQGDPATGHRPGWYLLEE